MRRCPFAEWRPCQRKIKMLILKLTHFEIQNKRFDRKRLLFGEKKLIYILFQRWRHRDKQNLDPIKRHHNGFCQNCWREKKLKIKKSSKVGLGIPTYLSEAINLTKVSPDASKLGSHEVDPWHLLGQMESDLRPPIS